MPCVTVFVIGSVKEHGKYNKNVRRYADIKSGLAFYQEGNPKDCTAETEQHRDNGGIPTLEQAIVMIDASVLSFIQHNKVLYNRRYHTEKLYGGTDKDKERLF